MNWFFDKTYAESSYVNRKAAQKNPYLKSIIVIVLFAILAIIMYYFKPHIDTSFLVTYNALVIAAVIFLLNFHFGELRDVSSWYIEGKPMTNHSFKPFHFWHGNATQPAAVKIVEVKAFFITLLLFSIIFLMVSSFIIIALIKALDILAFALTIISSASILTILIATFYVYIGSAKEYAHKHSSKG